MFRTTQSAYQLQAGDYDWYSADGSTRLSSAPTNVGNYMIKLNSTELPTLKLTMAIATTLIGLMMQLQAVQLMELLKLQPLFH